MTLTNLKARPKAFLKVTMIASLGMDAIGLFHSLPFASELEKEDIGKMLALLEQHFVRQQMLFMSTTSSSQRYNAKEKPLSNS